MGVSGFIFDLDGTLLDSSDCAVEATQRAFIAHGLPHVASDAIRRSMGIPIEQMFPEFAGELGQETDWETVFSSFRTLYGELSKTLVKSFDGIGSLLESIHNSNRPVAVVTSKKTSVAIANCRQVGIDHLIHHFVGSDLVDHYKPHPDGVLRAAALCQASENLSSLLVIGDASVDIVMGQKAGTLTCAALWGTHSRQDLLASGPTFIAEDPKDILALDS